MSEGLTEQELSELKQILREEFSDYYEKAGGRDYRYFHLKFVHRAVNKLAGLQDISDLDFDHRVLEISALFHDIGRSKDIEDGFMDPFEGHEGHAATGSEIVSSFVSGYVSEEQLPRIEKIIENHHSDPETVEGKILQDADDLAKYGVSDIWRMIHYASEEDMTIEEGYDNFRKTLLPRLKKGLEDFHFDPSVKIAETRLQKQKDFVKEMQKEMNAGDFEGISL
jgi:HD superfamily phosphodiesterase